MKNLTSGILGMLFLISSLICVGQKQNTKSRSNKTIQKVEPLFLPTEFFGMWVTSLEKCSIKYKECDEEGEPFILSKSLNGIEMSGPQWHSKILRIAKISENSYKISYRELHCELDHSDTWMIITLKGNNKLLVNYGSYKEEYIKCQ